MAYLRAVKKQIVAYEYMVELRAKRPLGWNGLGGWREGGGRRGGGLLKGRGGREQKLWCNALLLCSLAASWHDLRSHKLLALWQHLHDAARCESCDGAPAMQPLPRAEITNGFSQLHHLTSVMSPDIVLYF